MSQLSQHFQNSPVLAAYTDTGTREFVCEFLQATYEKEFLTKKASVLQHLYNLSAFTKNITISEITTDSVVSFLLDASPGRRKILIQFLIYMCKKGYFHEDSSRNIRRLPKLEQFFTEHPFKARHAIYVLTNPHFEELMASALFAKREEKYGYSALFFELPSDEIVADGVFPVLKNFIESTKCSSTETPTKIIRGFEGINYGACKLFNKPGPVCITPSDIMNVFDDAEKTYSPPTPAQIFTASFKMLRVLKDKGLISDRHICAAVDISSRVSTLTNNMIRNIFASDHPEQFSVFTFQEGSHAGENHVVYIDIASASLREAATAFLSQYNHTDSGTIHFFSTFDTSLMPIKNASFSDLSFNTFSSQIEYYKTHSLKKRIISACTAFYLYLQQHYVSDVFEKSGIPDCVLHRSDVGYLIADGYSVVIHNPLEPVPSSNKWLLCYFPTKNSSVIETRTLDFTTVRCPLYKDWLKSYIWHEDVKVETKAHPFYNIRDCLNYLYDLKTGAVASIFARPSSQIARITSNDAAALRNHIITMFDNNRTILRYIYGTRSVLQYVSDNKLGHVDPGFFYNLSYTLSNDYDTGTAIPDAELILLTDAFKKRALTDNIAAICYSVVYIALETELRPISIYGLKTDCVLETAKKGEHVIAVEEKTSGGEIVHHPITKYCVKEIEEVRRRTEDYRNQCVDEMLHGTLFIIPHNKIGTFKQIDGDTVNKYIKKCCSDAGIANYTMRDVRKTHMTNALRYKIKNSLSDLQQNILSGHKSPVTDDIHYARLDIREMLESVHGIVIGKEVIKGSVGSESDVSIMTPDNSVSNGCGYCKSKDCNELSYIDCLLCKDFVTFPDRLPFFKERIATINEQIQKASVPHDKEDLANIKKLLVMYEEQILIRMKEDSTDE
ncbi:MAG: hypothetical protein IKE28_02285 [Solobacterium sp.]|nr:hypothetical protein [Solobacterium sp.]